MRECTSSSQTSSEPPRAGRDFSHAPASSTAPRKTPPRINALARRNDSQQFLPLIHERIPHPESLFYFKTQRLVESNDRLIARTHPQIDLHTARRPQGSDGVLHARSRERTWPAVRGRGESSRLRERAPAKVETHTP